MMFLLLSPKGVLLLGHYPQIAWNSHLWTLNVYKNAIGYSRFFFLLSKWRDACSQSTQFHFQEKQFQISVMNDWNFKTTTTPLRYFSKTCNLKPSHLPKPPTRQVGKINKTTVPWVVHIHQTAGPQIRGARPCIQCLPEGPRGGGRRKHRVRNFRRLGR